MTGISALERQTAIDDIAGLLQSVGTLAACYRAPAGSSVFTFNGTFLVFPHGLFTGQNQKTYYEYGYVLQAADVQVGDMVELTNCPGAGIYYVGMVMPINWFGDLPHLRISLEPRASIQTAEFQPTT